MLSKSSKQCPSILELTEQLETTPEELQKSKRDNYGRKFRLWVPMVHDFETNGDEGDDGVIEEVEVLPVDELLDRVMLRQVRVAAVERGLFFLLCIFLHCACLIMQRSLANAYELESALKIRIESGNFKFSELKKVGDIWDWMQNSFIENIIPESKWYNGDAIEDEALQGYTSFYNKQCGGFSLVQHRASEYSSKLYMPSYHRLYPRVWPDLGGESSTSKPVGGLRRGDDIEPFGPAYDPEKYQWTKDTAGEFQGGGYTVRFPTREKKVKYMMDELKSDLFVDKATRRLMFIVTVLNANLKLFAVIRFDIGIDAAGKITAFSKIASIKAEYFVNYMDYVRLAVECIVVLLVVYDTYTEILTIGSVGLYVYLNFWNTVDSLRRVLFYYCVVTYVMILNDPIRQNPEAVNDMCNGTGEWMNFPKLAKLEEDYVFCSALCLLISTLLIFKFLTPFPKFGIFVHTMNEAGNDLLNFTIVLFILLFGFSIMGHILFGHVLGEYATVLSAIESVVLLAIGEFEYAPLVEASSPTTAAMFFYSFIFIITLVVMQMVIAIVFGAYDNVREKIDDSEEFLVMPTILRKIVLGRTPSLAEQVTPLHKILKISLINVVDFISSGGGFRRGRQVTPESQEEEEDEEEEGETVTLENFSDEHLLHLFDSQNIFRLYGILSPKIEEFIKKVKGDVAKERSVLRKMTKSKSQSQSFRLTETPRGRNLIEEIKDPWALDQVEFCALLKALDKADSALHIDINHSNEYRISKLVFSAYSRQQSKKKSTFKTRVEKKLAGLVRVLDAIDTRQQEKDDIEFLEKDVLAVKLKRKKKTAFETTNGDKLKLPRTRNIPRFNLADMRSSANTKSSVEEELEESEM